MVSLASVVNIVNCVVRVDVIMFGRDEHDVALSGNLNVWNIQRLGINAAVDGIRKQLAEGADIDIAGVRVVSLAAFTTDGHSPKETIATINWRMILEKTTGFRTLKG